MAAEVAFVDPITCLAAPAAWLPEGLFVDGVRILSRWDVLVDGAAPTPVSSHRAGASSAVFSAVAAGPELTVVRRRLAEPMGGTETITLSNAADVPMTVTVTVLAEALASARIETTPPCAGTPLTWTAEVPPRGSWQVEARITRTDIPPTARPKRFSTLRVTADDPRLDALVRAGVQDLDALRRTAGPDAYYSTSSPSHLTLSPREALWAARLALPLGHDVAAGTLRLVANAITADLAPLFTATRAAAIRWGMPPDAAPPGPASNRAPASNPAPAGTSGNSVDPAAVVGDRASVFGASDAVSEGGDAGSGRADAGSVGGNVGSGRADAGSVGGNVGSRGADAGSVGADAVFEGADAVVGDRAAVVADLDAVFGKLAAVFRDSAVVFEDPSVAFRTPAVIADLLAAAERLDYRLPTFDGTASARPHACGAAIAPAILVALLGLDVDVPGGRITFDPLTPSPVGTFRVRGLKIADGLLDATLTAGGTLTVHNGPLGVTFHNADGSPARIA